MSNCQNAIGVGASGVAAPSPRAGAPRPGLMLALVTTGFAVMFWAWALLSSLAATLR